MTVEVFSDVENYQLPVFSIKQSCRLKSLTFINRLNNISENENYINFGNESFIIEPGYYASRAELIAAINNSLSTAESKTGFGQRSTMSSSINSISHSHICSSVSLHSSSVFTKLTAVDDGVWNGQRVAKGRELNVRTIDVQSAISRSYDLTLTNVELPSELIYIYYSDGLALIVDEQSIESAKLQSFKLAGETTTGEFSFAEALTISSFSINQGVIDDAEQPSNYSPIVMNEPVSIPYLQLSMNGSVTLPITPTGWLWNAIGYSQSEKPTSYLTECGEFTLLRSNKLELRLSMSNSVFDGTLIYSFTPTVSDGEQERVIIQSSTVIPTNSYIYISGGLANGRYLLEVEPVD